MPASPVIVAAVNPVPKTVVSVPFVLDFTNNNAPEATTDPIVKLIVRFPVAWVVTPSIIVRLSPIVIACVPVAVRDAVAAAP